MRCAALAVVMILSLAAFGETITITLDCGSPCSDADRSKWGRPPCPEYDLNTALIEALARDDRSALTLLEERYRTSETYSERYRIGAALLRRTRDDAGIWRNLEMNAEIAVHFPHLDDEHTPEFIAWCAERSVDPDDQWWASFGALMEAAGDPRSRSLLERALAAEDRNLVMAAIEGFARQRDESALSAIDEALKRWPDEAEWLAVALHQFRSANADALATRYLSETYREAYDEQRAQQP